MVFTNNLVQGCPLVVSVPFFRMFRRASGSGDKTPFATEFTVLTLKLTATLPYFPEMPKRPASEKTGHLPFFRMFRRASGSGDKTPFATEFTVLTLKLTATLPYFSTGRKRLASSIYTEASRFRINTPTHILHPPTGLRTVLPDVPKGIREWR